MKIRSQLIISFFPVVFISLLLAGGLAIYAVNYVSNNTDRISDNLIELQDSAKVSNKKAVVKIQQLISADFKLLLDQFVQSLELNKRFLSINLETTSQSTLIESFIDAPANARSFVGPQVSSLLNHTVKNFNLSEISILDTSGVELLRVAVEIFPDGVRTNAFDSEPLANSTTDESSAGWFLERKKTKMSISEYIYFNKDYGVVTPEPVLSLSIPIKIKNKLKAYMKYEITFKELFKNITSVTGDDTPIIITDNYKSIIATSIPDMMGSTIEAVPLITDCFLFSKPIFEQMAIVYLLVPKNVVHKNVSDITQLSNNISQRVEDLRTIAFEVKLNLSRLWLTFISLIAGASLLVLIALIILSKKISKPIIVLSEAASKIGEGNLDVQLDLNYKTTEMSNLGHSIDLMRLQIKNDMDNLADRIWEQTSDLEESNTLLREEIRIRKISEEYVKAANASKNEFLANMSHEIRTPMNGVMGMIIILKDSNPNEEQREYLEILSNCADSLMGIINDILDYSKIEARQLNLKSNTFAIRPCIENAFKPLFQRSFDKNIALELQIDDTVPHSVFGDSLRLKQILTNLVNNAIKFTIEGCVHVEIKCSSTEFDEATLVFSVADTGVGMTDSDMEKVFNIFTQADSSTTKEFGGTGLGLSICKSLVDLMGGAIWVESSKDCGSVFFFSIILPLGENAIVETIDPAWDDDEPFVSDSKILVVEDNDANRHVISTLLTSFGCRVDVADNGRKGVELASINKYDLVLMDCQMPILDGYEAVNQIRLLENDGLFNGYRTPIVALTANVVKGNREKCIKAGMDDFLAKPIDFERLLGVLETYCHKNHELKS